MHDVAIWRHFTSKLPFSSFKITLVEYALLYVTGVCIFWQTSPRKLKNDFSVKLIYRQFLLTCTELIYNSKYAYIYTYIAFKGDLGQREIYLIEINKWFLSDNTSSNVIHFLMDVWYIKPIKPFVWNQCIPLCGNVFCHMIAKGNSGYLNALSLNHNWLLQNGKFTPKQSDT